MDEWREARGERELAGQYLADLTADVAADSVILSLLERAIVGQRRSVGVIRDGSAVDLREALRLHRNIAYMVELPPPGSTYEELLATGNLRLISSPELRRGAVSYFRYRDNAGMNLRDAREGLGLLAPPADYAALLPYGLFSQDNVDAISDSALASVAMTALGAGNPPVRNYLTAVTTYHGMAEQIIGDNLRSRNTRFLAALRAVEEP